MTFEYGPWGGAAPGDEDTRRPPDGYWDAVMHDIRVRHYFDGSRPDVYGAKCRACGCTVAHPSHIGFDDRDPGDEHQEREQRRLEKLQSDRRSEMPAARTFEEFHRVAKFVDDACDSGALPDTEAAVDAVKVARTLMDWLWEHGTDAQRAQVSDLLTRAVLTD